jgi:O-antigen/teichoic acid export membrane protein
LTTSAAGQAAVLAASPLLARLYSPDDFGVLAAIVALSTIGGSAVTLCWERAIPLPRAESAARALALLAGATTVAMSIGIAVVLACHTDAIAGVIGVSGLKTYWWICPITVASIGLQRIVSTLSIRQSNFASLSRRNLLQSTGQLAANFGLAWTGPAGLLLGTAMSRLAGGLVVVRRQNRRIFRVSARRLGHTAHQFRRFPLISTWSALANSVGVQLPILLLSGAYGSLTVGFLAFAMRLTTSPTGLAAEALGQRLDASASRAIRDREAVIGALVRRHLLVAGTITLIGGSVAALVCPPVITWIFGGAWRESGDIARLLIPVAGAQLVVVPISRVLTLLQRQRTQLFWDILRGTVTIGVVMLTIALGKSIETTLAAWTALSVAAYALMIALVMSACRRFDDEILTSVAPRRRPTPAPRQSS